MISLNNSNMIFDLQAMPYGKNSMQCILYNGVENINPYGIHGKFQTDLEANHLLSSINFNSLTSGRLIMADPYLGPNSQNSQNYLGYYYSVEDGYTNPKQDYITPIRRNFSLMQYDSATSLPALFQISYLYIESELEKILSTNTITKYLCLVACCKEGAPFIHNIYYQDDTNISQDIDPIYTISFYKMPITLSNTYARLGFNQGSQVHLSLSYSTVTTLRSQFFKSLLDNTANLNSYTLYESTQSFPTYNSLHYLPIGYEIIGSTAGCSYLTTDCYYLRLYVIEKSASDPITKEEIFDCAKNYIYEEAIYIQK